MGLLCAAEQIIAAQIMEGDPVLVMQFETQQITCIRDGVGAIVEGGDVSEAHMMLVSSCPMAAHRGRSLSPLSTP
jgi:hypothetical protein